MSEAQENLGPLSLLEGVWKNTGDLEGHGWNMIALPFPGSKHKYKLLLNQYNETLTFELADEHIVKNRGLEGDQGITALAYNQEVTEIASSSAFLNKDGQMIDRVTEHDEGHGVGIHREPGLWLHMLDHKTNSLNIARLATIPHGDSVLALGESKLLEGAPEVQNISGLPVTLEDQLAIEYLSPYRHFSEKPFKGLVKASEFIGFNPVTPNELLDLANKDVTILRSTKLEVDTNGESGGIVNIPFVVKQANATEMKSTFWISRND
ncbi:MAG: hypothetical protein HRT88_12720 [Lentisphaeraceae bacterium]|nr:hypothetical protein [Lentisphaeraceae bacterium]